MDPEPTPSAQPDRFLLDLSGSDAETLKIELYSRLAERFLPGSPYEQLRVEEMAAAWLEVWSLRGQMATARQFLRTEAAQRYEEKTRLHYQKLDKSLLRSHGVNQQALAAHAYGAELLADRWRDFYLHTAEQKQLEIHQVCAILVAEGCSDLMQAMDRRAVWLVSRMMKRYKNPEFLASEWAEYSRLKPAQAITLVERLVEEAEKLPSFDETFSQMLEYAHQRLEFWSSRAKSLMPEHLQQKAAFCQGFLSYPGAAPGIRSLIGLEKLQLARITQLEREFRQLQRERQRDEDRAREQAARLEAIRSGTALPRRRPAKNATTTTDAMSHPVIPDHASLDQSQSETALNPAENTIGQEPQGDPQESGRVVELIEAVQQYASRQCEPTPPEPSEKVVSVTPRLTEARGLISRLSDTDLAQPLRHPQFKRLFHQCNHQQRKDLFVLVNSEKSERRAKPAYQASG